MWRAALFWVAGAACAAYVVLGVAALTSGLVTPTEATWLVIGGPPMVAGALYLMWRRPEHPIGMLLMATALLTLVLPTILEIPTVISLRTGGPEPWMWAPIWAAQTFGLLGAVTAAAMLALLPDGQFRFVHERLLIWAAAVAALPTLALLSNEVVQTYTYQFPGVRAIASPIFVPALRPIGPPITAALFLANLVVVAGIAALIVRYRRTSRREQRQLRWVLLAGIVALIVNVVPMALGQLGVVPALQHDLVATVTYLPSLLVPLAIVATVMEPAWIDVDIVIRRSFVYGTLSLVILAVYVAAAAWAGLAAGSALPLEAAIVVTVVMAVALQPLRSRLQAWADRRVFGAPPTRYAALADFGSRMDDVADPGELVGQLAATAHRALRLSWATVSVHGVGSETAGSRSGGPAASVDIRHRGDMIGRLECGPPTDRVLGPEDVALLSALAGQAGLAISNARLAGRIVAAQEEERRRIERNLHDGAQQELVALVAHLGLARSRLEAGTLDVVTIDELQTAVRGILADVRELAQGIHPSIVTDGGIVAAVEERCASLPLDVTLDVEHGLRRVRFPARIEGAAYFVVAESLANVLKHARARRATVAVGRRIDRLWLSVADDGTGFDPVAVERRGLAGLEDRIAALGGTVRVASRPGGGTTVTASLPIGP